MSYRESRAYRLSLIAAAVQKANLRHRVGTLENVRAPAVSVRRRKVEVR